MSKYGARRTLVDGMLFDSHKEAMRWLELRGWEQEGRISNLRRQMPFDFIVNRIKICRYVVDMVYIENGKEIYEDVKGYKKGAAWQTFQLKAKLMRALYGIEILVT